MENKPTLVNSSFTYDSGRNLNGVTGYSCADLYRKGLEESGIFYLQIDWTRFWYLKVYCDMSSSNGGWTVSEILPGNNFMLFVLRPLFFPSL